MTRRSRSPQRILREVNQRLLLSSMSAEDERAAAEAELQQHLEALTIIAHELRNGIAPIQAAADLLARTQGRDQVILDKLERIINRNTSHLTRLIADLLDESRARTGQFRIERRPVDMLDIVRDSVATCQANITRRRQSIEASMPPGQLTMLADPVRLTQIFVNLVDNASKYTPAGGSIAVVVAREAEVARVTISDNGSGIDPNMLHHMFDLYARAPRDGSDNPGGLGVGLAVVRQLVKAHGGTVSAESGGSTGGSRFTVTLPLTIVSDDAGS